MRIILGVSLWLGGCGGAQELGVPMTAPDPWPLGGTTADAADAADAAALIADAKSASMVWRVRAADGVRFEHVHVRCEDGARGQAVFAGTDEVSAAPGCAVYGETVDGEVMFRWPDGEPGPVACAADGECLRREEEP